MGSESIWQPDWAVAPGEILLEALQERSMTQAELARRIDRPLKTINEIVKGKAAITPDTAIQLERALGISSRLWNGLEADYREHLARERAQLELERDASWIDRFPVVDLIRNGLIQKKSTKAETLSELLTFFRVSSPSAWSRHWIESGTSFRASPAFEASPESVAAWLRWGEIEAASIESSAFDSQRFREALSVIRTLTRREPFAGVVEQVRELCAESGVAMVLTPEMKGTHLSGAARWLSSTKALLQLSLRHQSDDHFWFSFFHEAGHILEPTRRRDFIDSAESESLNEQQQAAETAADSFARELLVPQEDYESFLRQGSFSSMAIQGFAKEIGISAGIVVGRLQRDNVVPRSHLNNLKRPIRWGR
jgi:HTH-type transcriptional regulator/antitoxin HigA